MSSSSISFTVGFSKEDEEREIKELTDAEKEAILDDMYGRQRRRTSDGSNNNNNEGGVDDDEEEHDGNERNGEEHDDDDDSDSDDDDDDEDINVDEVIQVFGGEDDDGNNNNNNDNADNIILHDVDDITDELMQEFFAAFDRIPQEQSKHFWNAFNNPFCVVTEPEHESDPAYFIRCEAYNLERAALRICKYWNARVDLFGEEHAFQQLTLENTGMKDVIPYMVEIPNFLRILPNDSHGRTVICFDITGFRLKDYDYAILVKINWFVAHQAITRNSTQEHGIVAIAFHQSSNWDFPSYNLIKWICKSYYDCFPMKMCCSHSCLSSLVATCVFPIFQFFASREARLRFQLHNTVKKLTLIKELETFGLHRDHLPKSIGGTYDEKPSWIIECERILKEQRHRKKSERRTFVRDDD